MNQCAEYHELLELTLMFLERVPPRGILFRKPGAIHRARFMSRLIHVYALKIGLFRDAGFKATKRETQGLVDFCVFGVVAYIKSWFLCCLPTVAPDLNLLKLLMQVESPSANGALKKLCGQLWYTVVKIW